MSFNLLLSDRVYTIFGEGRRGRRRQMRGKWGYSYVWLKMRKESYINHLMRAPHFAICPIWANLERKESYINHFMRAPHFAIRPIRVDWERNKGIKMSGPHSHILNFSWTNFTFLPITFIHLLHSYGQKSKITYIFLLISFFKQRKEKCIFPFSFLFSSLFPNIYDSLRVRLVH